MSKAAETESATVAGTGDGCVDIVCHGCGHVHQNATIKVLPDGRRVGLQSEEWRHHCELLAVMRLPDKPTKRKMSKFEYLVLVRQKRGDDAADRLRRDMSRLWREQHASD